MRKVAFEERAWKPVAEVLFSSVTASLEQEVSEEALQSAFSDQELLAVWAVYILAVCFLWVEVPLAVFPELLFRVVWGKRTV